MLPSNQNFLNINYQKGKGLKLDWNFKDILGRDKYFRHLIVVINHEKQQVFSFVENFYKKMKFGDILSCLYANSNNQVKICLWIQKTHLNKFKIQSYLKQISTLPLAKNIKSQLMQRAANQTLIYNDYMVVNVLLGATDNIKIYRQIIEEGRSLRKQFRYIVNLFTNKQENHISVHKGINIFNSSSQNITQYAQFYHSFINSAVIPFAKINIQYQNGQLGLFHQQNWVNGDFNTIQASYYGPSSQYRFDRLLFYFQDFRRSIDIHLKVTLDLKLFSGKQYRSIKKVHLNYCYQKDVSVSMREVQYFNYIIFKDIELREDPYQCSTILRIFNKIQNQEQLC